MLDLLLLVLILIVLAGQVYVPWAKAPPGTPVARLPLPLLARLRLHARIAFVVLVVTTIAAVTGWISLWLIPVVLAAVAVLMATPVHYTLTTDGIALGRTPFHRWTEFGGVARRPGGARLQGGAGARGRTVWLAGFGDTADTVFLLRQMVRGSYQGQLGRAPTTEASGDDADHPLSSLEPARAIGR